MSNIFRFERVGLRSSNLVPRRATKICNMDKRRDLQDKRSRSQGHVMRLTGLADRSRMKRRRNTKFGRMVANPTGNNAHQFQGQRSKVKVTRSTRTENAQCLLSKKGYEDPYHGQAPWPPRSKVKVARSRDASDRCWPVSEERKGTENQK